LEFEGPYRLYRVAFPGNTLEISAAEEEAMLPCRWGEKVEKTTLAAGGRKWTRSVGGESAEENKVDENLQSI